MQLNKNKKNNKYTPAPVRLPFLRKSVCLGREWTNSLEGYFTAALQLLSGL